jgi:hypothetical protein
LCLASALTCSLPAVAATPWFCGHCLWGRCRTAANLGHQAVLSHCWRVS